MEESKENNIEMDSKEPEPGNNSIYLAIVYYFHAYV